MSSPGDPATAPVPCDHVQVDAVGDHRVVNIGVAPLVADGIYRFEVAVTSQPPVSIDMPIVIAGYPNPASASSSHRGMNHVGLS
jgi:hypothetical protein